MREWRNAGQTRRQSGGNRAYNSFIILITIAKERSNTCRVMSDLRQKVSANVMKQKCWLESVIDAMYIQADRGYERNALRSRARDVLSFYLKEGNQQTFTFITLLKRLP